MNVKEYEGKTLSYLAVEPEGYEPHRSYPIVILLHGFGANMHDLAGLCPSIGPAGYVFICPNAPLAVELGPGTVGYAWTPPGGAAEPGDASAAEEALAELFAEVMDRYDVEPGQLVLGGFSQGGMMTYRCGLADPDTFRGLLVLSASLPEPDTLRRRLPSGRTQSIFIAHGTADSMIAVERAREASSFLEAEGYRPDYREYPMGHEITQDVLGDLVPWLRNVLKPVTEL